MSLPPPKTINGVTCTILAAHPIAQPSGSENRIVLLQYPPGVPLPPHTHPVDGVNYIIQSTVESEGEVDDKIEVFKQWKMFLDYPETNHMPMKNPTTEVESKLLVSHVIMKGVPNVVMCE